MSDVGDVQINDAIKHKSGRLNKRLERDVITVKYCGMMTAIKDD